MVHRETVLALYDAQMRREPLPEPGTTVEHVGPIVRVVGEENYVLFSDLSETNAREAVAAQAEHFRRRGAEVEWKTFGHDRPAELPTLLEREGFVSDAPETLVVFDLGAPRPSSELPPGLEIRRVTDAAGLADAIRASEAAFGTDPHRTLDRYRDRLTDPTVALFVVYANGSPVAMGRLEMPVGRAFASLWGGGTAPPFRHRGVYRSLVAARAELAQRRGYSYLTVDARATSLPILKRLGFVVLTTTQGWVLHPLRVQDPPATSVFVDLRP